MLEHPRFGVFACVEIVHDQAHRSDVSFFISSRGSGKGAADFGGLYRGLSFSFPG